MDICMCTGNCPRKENCLRYMGKPDPYGQTYSLLEEVCIPNDYAAFIPYEKNINKKQTISYTLDDFIMDEMRKNKSKTN